MEGDDDLGLMRRRAYGHHHRHLPPLLNLMPPPPLSSCAASPSSPPPVAFPCPKTTHYCSTWKARPTAEMSGRGAAGPLLLLGQEIDVNSEEDARASSPNSALSTASGKTRRRTRTVRVQGNDDDDDSHGLCWRALGDEEEDCEGVRKKLRLSKEQTAVLEQSFKAHSNLNPKLKMALAGRLNVTPRQVEVWFQNRRARTKSKQTEVECEFLRRCCERLAEENKQLREEVEELRAQQKRMQSPRFYMHMVSPATVSVCPSCDRISDDPGSAAAAITIDAAEHRPFRPIPALPRPLSRIKLSL